MQILHSLALNLLFKVPDSEFERKWYGVVLIEFEMRGFSRCSVWQWSELIPPEWSHTGPRVHLWLWGLHWAQQAQNAPLFHWSWSGMASGEYNKPYSLLFLHIFNIIYNVGYPCQLCIVIYLYYILCQKPPLNDVPWIWFTFQYSPKPFFWCVFWILFNA